MGVKDDSYQGVILSPSPSPPPVKGGGIRLLQEPRFNKISTSQQKTLGGGIKTKKSLPPWAGILTIIQLS